MPYYPPYPYRPSYGNGYYPSNGYDRLPGYGGGFHNNGNIIVTTPVAVAATVTGTATTTTGRAVSTGNRRHDKSPISSAKPESFRSE